MSERRPLRAPSLESLFVATYALFGVGVGTRQIVDNSALVHLRTGADIARGLGIPRTDPYSYTARGTRWVVQSWLPAAVYGWTDRVLGQAFLLLVQAALMGLLGWLIARLARTGVALRTLVTASVAVGIGAAYWAPRPLLVGLLAMVLLITVVERRASPWWLLPILWVWVNSHGSFPLGGLWLGLTIVGESLDTRALPTARLRYLGVYVLGLVLAVINPLGPRLLLFAFSVGEKREAFKTIVEWRSPDFQAGNGFAALIFIVAFVVILSRVRLAWVDTIPVVVFLALGLIASRNVPVLGLVIAPVLGRAWRRHAVPPTTAGGPINLAMAGVLVVAAGVFAVGAFQKPAIALEPYPVAAVRWLDRHGLRSADHRLVHEDTVGCYLIFKDGRRANVFVDDRVDMYPLAVSRDYDVLLAGEPGALRVLDRRKADAVLWHHDKPLVALLQASGEWRRGYRSGSWVVYVRRPL